MSIIHPTAIIENGAIIEENVSIGAYSYISSQAKIGSGTKISSHVVIDGDTTIGKNNTILSHCVLGSPPQDLKYKGEPVKLIIGDNNTIREFALINPGTKGGGSITCIGNNNLLMGYVHLAHDVHIGDYCILANAANVAGHVIIGNHVVIGGLTPIHQFVKIGDYVMIAGGSALAQDIPPFCLAEGNRATLRGLNLVGLRRKLSRDDINELKSAYRQLFEQGQPLQEVANNLYQSSNSSKVKELCQFIMESKRGIPFERKQQ